MTNILRGLPELTWIEIKVFIREPLGAIGSIVIPVLLFVLLVMAACFVLAWLPDEALDFTGRYAHTPFSFEYRLVFLAFLGLGLVNAARLFWG